MMTLAAVLATTGIILGWSIGDGYWVAHFGIGTLVFILLMFQVTLGYLRASTRPPNPSAPVAARRSKERTNDGDADETDGSAVLPTTDVTTQTADVTPTPTSDVRD